MASSCVASSSTSSSPYGALLHARASSKNPSPVPTLASLQQSSTNSRHSFIQKLAIATPPLRLRLSVCVRAASQVETSSSPALKEAVPDTQFSIFKTSLGTIGLSVGLGLLSYGFGAYFNILPGAEWSAIMLTYGFPLAVIGMALKYAELKPVPCITYADALAKRESEATPTLKQAGGIQRRNAPVLQAIREEVSAEGKYTLVLVFEAKALEAKDFIDRQAKFASFFGPGISAEIGTGGGDNVYEVKLVVDGGQ